MSKVKSNSKRAKKVKAKKAKQVSTMGVLNNFMRNSNLASNVTHYLPDGTVVIYCG